MSFSADVLRWMLKRVEQDRPIPEGCDLVNVRAHPALEPMTASIVHRDRTWRVATVSGELGLRRALLDTGPLIAMLPTAFDPPLDLNDRAYRRQVLAVQAQDLVAAASGRYSARIRDEVLADTILAAPEMIARSSPAWTVGPSSTTVTENEVRSVLLSVDMGLERKLERYAPETLLARWVTGDPPTTALGELLDQQLERVFGGEGRWLAQARQADGMANLIAAGALAGTEAGRRVATAPEGIDGSADEHGWSRLRRLVESAVRDSDGLGAAARDGLARAEERFHRLRSRPEEAGRFPLLRGALESALSELARNTAHGTPPDAEVLEALQRNLHYRDFEAAVDAVELCGRLARFIAAAPRLAPASASVSEWLACARRDLAWGDLAARQLRRHDGALPADVSANVGQVMDAYLDIRDQWNQRFAAALLAEEPQVYGQRDRRGPLPLASVSRTLLNPLIQAGQRVFLVVLDGCDLSTFLELLQSDSSKQSIGAVLPDLDGPLGDDLRHTGALNVGIAPLPTLTVHARRALFAGSLPKNPILDEDESSAANASNDLRAFEQNPSLSSIRRRLLLKGEIGVDGRAVREALSDPDLQLLAVVFNGVDDALSSHQMTAIPAWTWANVGSGLKSALERAFELDWTVLVTADHGHTPFIHPNRKAVHGRRTGGHRWSSAPCEGAVMLPAGKLRADPLYALTRMGAWLGPQARGFHGGVSLEEVAVPLAFLGLVSRPAESWPPPPWWSGGDKDEEGYAATRPAATADVREATIPTRPLSTPPAPAGSTAPAATPTRIKPSALSSRLQAELSGLEQAVTLIEHIARKQQLSLSQLAKLISRPAFLVRGPLSKAQARLHAAGITVPFAEEERDGEPWYRWTGETR